MGDKLRKTQDHHTFDPSIVPALESQACHYAQQRVSSDDQSFPAIHISARGSPFSTYRLQLSNNTAPSTKLGGVGHESIIILGVRCKDEFTATSHRLNESPIPP